MWIASPPIDGNSTPGSDQIPQWLVTLGPLGLSAIVGGVVVAAVTHFLTIRRERGKWLREQQVAANQQFYSAASAVIDHIGHDVLKELHFGREDKLPQLSEQLAQLNVKLGNKWAELMVVAEKRTKETADAIMETLPDLALLAIPLPGAVNRASRNQTNAMLDTMLGLAAHMLLVMRTEVGLSNWWKLSTRYEIMFRKEALKKARIRTKLALDLTEEDEPGGAPTPFQLLEFWEVKPLLANETPDSASGFYANNEPYQLLAADGGQTIPFPLPGSQGVLVKFSAEPWRFALADGLPDTQADKIMSDACRIITGNTTVFPYKYKPQHRKVSENFDVWIWVDVE